MLNLQELVITFSIVILISFALVKIAKKLNIPKVVALIFAGLLLGTPFIKQNLFVSQIDIIYTLGDIGLVVLMFLAGLKSSWKVLYTEKKDAMKIALFASLTPLLLGFIIGKFFGYSNVVSGIIGVCMSITAEATKANVLLGLKKLRTKVGSAMMGAGIIDDMIGMTVFIIITYIAKVSYVKEDLLIGAAILAFFIGITIERNVTKENSYIQILEKIGLIGIVPFFFISIGLEFNISNAAFSPLLLFVVVVVAIIGKLVGTLFAKRFTDFSFKQMYLIGWAMNSRGAVEMAIALIAFREGFIPLEVYSALIIMALLTTLIFPFIITYDIKKDPGIMD